MCAGVHEQQIMKYVLFFPSQHFLYQKSNRVGEDSICEGEMLVLKELIVSFPLFFQGGQSVGKG